MNMHLTTTHVLKLARIGPDGVLLVSLVARTNACPVPQQSRTRSKSQTSTKRTLAPSNHGMTSAQSPMRCLRHCSSRTSLVRCIPFPLALRQRLWIAHASTRTPPPDFTNIDSKWQSIWERDVEVKAEARQQSASDAATAKTKYVLPMFPYPSGTLHMGHIRVYTISDVIARFHTMKGDHVVHPIGWDAFGLPAENAAIERGIDPAEWTMRNIEQMKSQLKSMNGTWDWDREIKTCDPAYYKHTQHLFLQLYHAGLAYQKEALVNWDPVDNTVLANEQVDAAGKSWRSGAKVEQRMLKQWFLATTHFAEELYSDLLHLGETKAWPPRVVEMQKNWLGRSSGVEFPFDLEVVYSRNDATRSLLRQFDQIRVFTTRLDTLSGVQFIALALNHPFVSEYAKHDPDLQEFISTSKELPAASNAAYILPFTATNKLLGVQRASVYVAPYVLDGYGTGAVMGVPAHDARDYAFWRKHRKNEPVRFAIGPHDADQPLKADEPFLYPGKALQLGTSWDGLSSERAKTEILHQLQQAGYDASEHVKWRLRDWLISRQRYWGAPIPIIHCHACGAVPVPLHELPVTLPKVSAEQFAGKRGNPLEASREWVNTECPQCHGPARRDTDTMDTFMDSAWYFFRFADPQNQSEPVAPSKASALMPVDFYVGGVEHAILHLLYARFMAKFLASEQSGRIWSTSFAEPFAKLVTQGMVHGKTYSDPSTGRFLKPEEVDLHDESGPSIRASGIAPHVSFEKMSKSKYNGTDPTSCMTRHGADVTRAHILFAAPEAEVLEWEEERIVGMTRWLTRVWRLVSGQAGRLCTLKIPTRFSDLSREERNLLAELKSAQQSVDDKLSQAAGLNTVVSDLIKLTNTLESYTNFDCGREQTDGEEPNVLTICVQSLVRLMAPLTPAFSEECWQVLHAPAFTQGDSETFGTYTSLFNGSETWPSVPVVEESDADGELQTFVVSVNGKPKFTSKRLLPRSPAWHTEEMQQWLIDNVLNSSEGQRWLTSGRNHELLKVHKSIFYKQLSGGRWVVNVLT